MIAAWPPTRSASSAQFRGFAADDVERCIRAAPAGELAHRLGPFRVRCVIDRPGRAERLARSSFSSLDEVMIALAPAARASCRPKTDTPPVPSSSAVSPARRAVASKRPCQAVSAAQGRVAASSKERCSGNLMTPSPSSTTYSLSTPSAVPPKAASWASAKTGPVIQVWKKVLQTRSPGFTRVTRRRISTISPAPSESGIRGRGMPRM